MRKILIATAVALCVHPAAEAATTPADGYLYARQVLPQLTEGCVAQARGGHYVGVGPALGFPAPGGTRSILFVAADGTTTTVASGFNSIGDCVYDAATDTLYVTDSGAEFAGATTGDTVFAIPGDAVGAMADGHEVVPAGSIPQAFGVDLTATGLLVSDATGGGAGSVLAIDLGGTTPAVSTFAGGFDYTGGVKVDGTRVLVSEAVQPSFESAIYSYSPAGAYQSTLSGPTYAHGSIDLDVAADGGVLATGASTIVSIDAMGTVTPLVTGLDGGGMDDAFGGGVSVDRFTGRIDFLASTFSGADDDKAVHSLVPVDRLVPGGGNPATDCAMEVYGVAPGAVSGPRSRSAVCTDGAACDADGAVNGSCEFPLGLCLNVGDPALADCAPTAVASVELLSARPASAAVTDLVARTSALLPTPDATCVFSDGVVVPVRTLASGATRPGKATIKLRATTDDARPLRDGDVIRLLCQPAQS